MKNRLFGSSGFNFDTPNEGEQVVRHARPTYFLLTMESETEDGTPMDLVLTVPFESLNHVMYVLAFNGVAHRVEPVG